MLLLVAGACADDGGEHDGDANPDGESDAADLAGGADGGATAAPDALHPVSEQTLAWATELITAYDRTIAASCECLVSPDAFASVEDCMAALGSSPEWLDCAADAIARSDAGFSIAEADARCMIDNAEARSECLEHASCEPEAMTACLDMPAMAETCAALDNDLVVLLLEQCPDLGLISRVP